MMKYLRLSLVTVFVLLFSPSSYALDVTENLNSFVKSVIDNANQISWSSKYNFQDVQFVENEMDGDETVHARAWFADHYIMIRHYENKSWSSSYVSKFWTDSDELTFANGIKVGSSVNQVKAYLGNFDYGHGNNHYIGEDGMSVGFTINNNKVTAISFNIWESMTDKTSDLFSLYDGSYSFAEVTGEKVNLRNQPNTSGRVITQVNKSKRDCLIVSTYDASEGWRYVPYRAASGKNLRITAVKGGAYISSQFLKVRSLTRSERMSLINHIVSSKR